MKDARKPAFRHAHPRGRQWNARFRPQRGDAGDGVVLYGWHTVTAALANPGRRIRKLLATENALRRLVDDGIAVPIAPDVVRPHTIAAMLSPDAVHQGLLAEADPLPSPPLSKLGAAGIVLVLDQITDPHNVGAILRTAAAFRGDAIVMTERHAPEMTGVLAKAASGGLEHVPIVHVVNLARALAIEPAVVLLDEPFASLDAHLRASVRADVQEIFRRAGTTAVLVTHDQDEALSTADPQRLGPLLRDQGRVVLAIDGLQPDVGHEVLWVLRDCLSGEILLARSLLSATAKDLGALLASLPETR